MALGLPSVDSDKTATLVSDQWHWNPQHDDWPALDDPRMRTDPDRWVDLTWKQYQMRLEDTSWHLDLYVFHEAVGVYADWRSLLHFLCRLSRVKQKGNDTLELIPPNYDVIDSFFLHVVTGKRPNLAHNMLCSLTDPLRFRILLTTNFDELIEKAFFEADDELTVIPVHQLAGLPSAACSMSRSLFDQVARVDDMVSERT